MSSVEVFEHKIPVPGRPFFSETFKVVRLQVFEREVHNVKFWQKACTEAQDKHDLLLKDFTRLQVKFEALYNAALKACHNDLVAYKDDMEFVQELKKEISRLGVITK